MDPSNCATGLPRRSGKTPPPAARCCASAPSAPPSPHDPRCARLLPPIDSSSTSQSEAQLSSSAGLKIERRLATAYVRTTHLEGGCAALTRCANVPRNSANCGCAACAPLWRSNGLGSNDFTQNATDPASLDGRLWSPTAFVGLAGKSSRHSCSFEHQQTPSTPNTGAQKLSPIDT